MNNKIKTALAECRAKIDELETLLMEQEPVNITVIDITITDQEMQKTIDWLEEKLEQTEEALEKALGNKCPRCHSTIQDGKRACIVCGMPLGKVAV